MPCCCCLPCCGVFASWVCHKLLLLCCLFSWRTNILDLQKILDLIVVNGQHTPGSNAVLLAAVVSQELPLSTKVAVSAAGLRK